MHHSLRLISLCLLVLSLAACAAQPDQPELETESTIAVVGFQNPQFQWELIAGCLPEQCNLVEPEVITTLNTILIEELGTTGREYIMPAVTNKCREVVLNEEGSYQELGGAMQYWLKVGECVPADLLLVPQLMYWRERDGNAYGAVEPASVVMDLYLIDVPNQRLVRRFHYEETQKALTSNLLDIGQFFGRGAKWVKAEVIARDGIEKGLQELGL